MDEKTKRITSALTLSILTGLMLALVKLATGLLTHSMAIAASALDSVMDVAVSSVNLFAAREAAKPPDEEHAYGHGKIESLAGLFQSIFIGLSGLYIIIESLKRLFLGSYVNQLHVGLGVMTFSAVASWLLVLRLQYVARHNHSLILTTEGLHFTTDMMTNGGVILALALVDITHFIFWDLVVSIVIAVYIFRTSFGILRRSIDELLDRGLSPVSKEEIEHLIRSYHPSIVGLHNFRSRSVGEQIFLDFHIEIRGEENFRRAHDMTESLIHQIQERYPGADITVHFDPEGAM